MQKGRYNRCVKIDLKFPAVWKKISENRGGFFTHTVEWTEYHFGIGLM